MKGRDVRPLDAVAGALVAVGRPDDAGGHRNREAPSCTGRRMNATAANLIERVLPRQSGLRQWVLTFPFPWRRRLAQDGALLGNLTRIFVETVHAFYAERAAREGALGGRTGAVTVVAAVQQIASRLDSARRPLAVAAVLVGAWAQATDPLSEPGKGGWAGCTRLDSLPRRLTAGLRYLEQKAPALPRLQCGQLTFDDVSFARMLEQIARSTCFFSIRYATIRWYRT